MNGLELLTLVCIGLLAVVAWDRNRRYEQASDDLGECLGMFDEVREEFTYDEWPWNLDPQYADERGRHRETRNFNREIDELLELLAG